MGCATVKVPDLGAIYQGVIVAPPCGKVKPIWLCYNRDMYQVFTELSFILVLSVLVGAVVQYLRQPLIIGHIVTGLLVGPYALNLLHSSETIEIFSHLGIALLIFIIGLSLSPRVIKEVGKVSLVTGIGQVVIATSLGFGVSQLFGFSNLTSLYIGLAFAFSSTIIILKLLSDKKDLGRLYGRIAIGFLLVQDIIAMTILIVATSLGQDQDLGALAVTSLLKGSLLLIGLYIVSVYVLPKVTAFVAKSQEFLFLFSLSWGLGIATLFQLAGFSTEIGALFAGVALANSPFAYEISTRMRPLRDFFIVLFFILLGAQMKIDDPAALVGPVLAFSALILIANPLIVMILISLLGYNKRTSFKTGMTIAQVSEFSLILVVLGNRLGQLGQEMVSLVTAVAVITITVSTYYILYADKLFDIFAPIIAFFERTKPKKETTHRDIYDVILFGFDHVGHDFIHSFSKLSDKFLVVDYNPEIMKQLTDEAIPCRYGDASDNEFLDELSLSKTKLVVSTIADYATTAVLLAHTRRNNKRAVIIVHSDNIEEAAELYENGATYVMMPHYLGATRTSALIGQHGFDLSEFIKEREKHLHYIERRRTPVAS